MKPGEKIQLVKARDDIVRSLDVTQVLPLLKRPDMYTQDDEERILSDPRRRERVILFLNIMEGKNSETYQAFCEILEERFPHLFLLLSNWDGDEMEGPFASHAHLDDEWSVLHRNREFIISQVDAAKIASTLRAKGVLTAEQEAQIMKDPQCERRTETFLDFLELKPPGTFAVFLEVISDIYPHVYLELTGGNDEEW